MKKLTLLSAFAIVIGFTTLQNANAESIEECTTRICKSIPKCMSDLNETCKKNYAGNEASMLNCIKEGPVNCQKKYDNCVSDCKYNDCTNSICLSANRGCIDNGKLGCKKECADDEGCFVKCYQALIGPCRKEYDNCDKNCRAQYVRKE